MFDAPTPEPRAPLASHIFTALHGYFAGPIEPAPTLDALAIVAGEMLAEMPETARAEFYGDVLKSEQRFRAAKAA